MFYHFSKHKGLKKKKNSLSPLCYIHRKKKAHSLCSVSFCRRQQGELTAPGVCVVFEHPLGSVQTSHFTTDAL